jgi:ribonuclease HI
MSYQPRALLARTGLRRARRVQTIEMAAPPDPNSPARTVVYTDGACIDNPGPGGWAWALDRSHYASGFDPKSTNQRMEVTAVLRALEAIGGPVTVVSDSTYVVNCFRDRWWEGWLRRGWRNSKKQPVANRDLWEPLVEAYLADPVQMHFRWVKGHSGDVMNDLVDRLAVDAAQTQRGRTGTGVPPDLGPPDRPAFSRRR